MRQFLSNRWFHTAILLVLLAAAITVRMKDYDWTQSLRFIAFDRLNQMHPRQPTDDVVIVDIDEASLGHEDLGQWPWSRLDIARLVSRLDAAGARAIVFDIVFAEADRTSPQSVIDRFPANRDDLAPVIETLERMPDNDEVLARTFENAGNVVTAFIWSADEDATRRAPELAQQILMKKQARPLKDTVPHMTGVATNLPVLAQAAAGNGSFGVTPEVDGIIRQVPLLFSYLDPETEQKTLYPSLAAEAVRVAQDPRIFTKIRTLTQDEIGPLESPLLMSIGKYEIPLDWDGRFFVYFSPSRQDRYIPAWRVIDGAVEASGLKDKIVFIGTSAEGLKDLRSTPLDLFIPGVELHVNVVEQIMTGDFLHRPQILQGVELLSIAIIGLLIIVLSPFIGAVILAAFTMTLVLSIAILSWHSFTAYGLLIDPVYPSLCILVLFVMSSLLSYIRTEAERRQVRAAFGLYISPDFMEELTKDPDKLQLGGETRELTVMFTDIRNFTSIAETMSPEALIQLMNDFLTPMSDLVMNNRGTIDKYMGDAMMAFWNAPLDDPKHAEHACRAALEMNRALVPLNDELKIRAQAERRDPVLLKAGIGISTGPASVGNMGSKQRFAYSAVGDTVNLAARLEGQTKYYGSSILISQETRDQISEFCTLEFDLIRVKGKTEPVRIYALLGDEAYEIIPGSFERWKTVHNDMLAYYRGQKFEKALEALERARELAEGRIQGFYALYAQRIKALIDNPPGQSWDGIYVATSK